jgi:hypothetical protein
MITRTFCLLLVVVGVKEGCWHPLASLLLLLLCPQRRVRLHST